MTAHTSVATINTNHGAIKINLFGNHAPVTVKNFEDLATGEETGTPFYNGVIFHRIIAGFMIQGGDPTGTGMGGPGYTFDDEPHGELTFNEPYKLAMANAGIRGGKGTNGSQFFITVTPTQYLWGKHTVFGEVADEASRKVVDKIANVATDSSDRPFDDVVIESVTIEAA
jgi:peptidyl-prolyl cis-trans isomerase A (cyclophilin A)